VGEGGIYLELLQFIQSWHHFVHVETLDVQHLIDVSVPESLVDVHGEHFSCVWVATLVEHVTPCHLLDVFVIDETHRGADLALSLRVFGLSTTREVKTGDELDCGPSLALFVLVHLCDNVR
jgi:hypothetical protein